MPRLAAPVPPNRSELDSVDPVFSGSRRSRMPHDLSDPKQTPPDGDLLDASGVLGRLADVIASRRGLDPSASYVARLLAGAPDAALKKVGEESAEVIMAAKDGQADRIVSEMADLWFHCLVALVQSGLRPEQVLAELARREGISGLDEKAARRAQLKT
jgi:phosphoribosyl-ATP pyrophosphohydrolase